MKQALLRLSEEVIADEQISIPEAKIKWRANDNLQGETRRPLLKLTTHASPTWDGTSNMSVIAVPEDTSSYIRTPCKIPNAIYKKKVPQKALWTPLKATRGFLAGMHWKNTLTQTQSRTCTFRTQRTFAVCGKNLLTSCVPSLSCMRSHLIVTLPRGSKGSYASATKLKFSP